MSFFNKLRQYKSTVTGLTSTQPSDDSGSDSLFDNLARSMAGSLTRREALKAAVTGLAGIALAKFGINTALAYSSDSNPICYGAPYYAPLQCCTPTGVVNKNPIANLALCPNKIANATHTCKPNGCGGDGGFSAWIVPDSFFHADFQVGCNYHDCCYDTCNSLKDICDHNLYKSMSLACWDGYPLDSHAKARNQCLSVAKFYFDMVQSKGEKYYNNAQKETCDCCDTVYMCGGVLDFTPVTDCAPPKGCIFSSLHAKCCDDGWTGYMYGDSEITCCPPGYYANGPNCEPKT